MLMGCFVRHLLRPSYAESDSAAGLGHRRSSMHNENGELAPKVAALRLGCAWLVTVAWLMRA
jgi:hypothetical protein